MSLPTVTDLPRELEAAASAQGYRESSSIKHEHREKGLSGCFVWRRPVEEGCGGSDPSHVRYSVPVRESKFNIIIFNILLPSSFSAAISFLYKDDHGLKSNKAEACACCLDSDLV